MLVEPDYYTRYPPLGLLKISTLHKSQGDYVKLVRGNKDVGFEPDSVYVTSLFTYSWEAVHDAVRFYKQRYPKSKVILGGIYASLLPDHAALSGADEVHVGLLPDAESLRPDWDLIPEWDGSVLFASRGCVRKCGFCSVPKLEGRPSGLLFSIKHLVEPSHKRVILWDNNILGNQNWREIFDDLAAIGKIVDFNQGVDARLITEEVAMKLKRLRFDTLRMAYDYKGIGPAVRRAIEILSAFGISKRKLVFYTLYNYIDTPEDFFEKVKELLSWGATSYPMRFEPLCSLKKNAYVSPHWTEEELGMVASARRVLGFSGAFPPYQGLVKKFLHAESFHDAFKLWPRGYKKRMAKRLRHTSPGDHIARKTMRFGGNLDWRQVALSQH
ncbi:MAG TPA: hypothetical protein VFE98_02680 [Candidatus Bathyarchaeia archaeon]|nr:hypothetical protein [Candidatus Bathyarchaeia archaeon]